LNVSEAFAVLSSVVKSTEKPADIVATAMDFDRVLGLRLAEQLSSDLPSEVKELLDSREQARKDGNYAQSDALRDQIAALGYTVLDTPTGQKISKS
jgi:cysteinyl-tRNA synthetase